MDKWVERIFKKNSQKLNSASHNNTRWYTDIDGFLEHSPSREACTTRGPPSRRYFHFGGSPLIYLTFPLLLQYVVGPITPTTVPYLIVGTHEVWEYLLLMTIVLSCLCVHMPCQRNEKCCLPGDASHSTY